MAFCKNCGAEIPAGNTFCANCGAPVQTQNTAQYNNNNFNNNNYNAQRQNAAQNGSFSDNINNLNNTPDYTAEFDPADIEANKVLSLFSYLGILFLIPLLAAKDSRYARFHANQGIVLFIAGIVVSVVGALLNLIPIFGTIIATIAGILLFVFKVLGIVNAVTGKAKELPLIGQIKILN